MLKCRWVYGMFTVVLLLIATQSLADELALVSLESNTDARNIAELPGVMVIRLLDSQAFLWISSDSSGKGDIPNLQVLDQNAENYDYWMAFATTEEARERLASYGRVVYEQEAEHGYHMVLALTHDFDYSGINLKGVLGINPLRKESVVIPDEKVNGDHSLTPDLDPNIQDMVNQISQDSFLAYDQHLEDYVTRNSWTDECEEAINWIKDQLDSFGLSTELFEYDLDVGFPRHDVIGEQPGLVNPDIIYIVIAHMDSTAGNPWGPETNAPGANDNGSGSASVIELARVLSQYTFENTIRYVCVSGEEQGLYGSYYYAQHCYNDGDDIAGVIDLDMTMYGPDGYKIMDAYYDDQSHEFTDNFDTYAEEYCTDLVVNPVYDPGMYYSDHAYFWQYGYPAFCGIEQEFWSDPYYHSTQDLQANYIEYLPFPTWEVKGVCGALATFAVPYGNNPVKVADFTAESVTDGVQLSWNSTTEEGFLGFNLYRQPVTISKSETGIGTKDSVGAVRINDYPISGENPCTFLDDTALAEERYIYSLKPVYLESEGGTLAQTEGSFDGAVSFGISNVYPNPATDVVNISFAVPPGQGGEELSLSLYDLSGREVAKIYSGKAKSGEQSLRWKVVDNSGGVLVNGLYILKLRLGVDEDMARLLICR